MSVGAPMTLPDDRVVVLVRQGCHLCDDAVVTIADVCAERGVRQSLGLSVQNWVQPIGVRDD